ncbi:MAG: hypothetical protein JRF65_06995 [Deltaproteobacteria bacterium]|nr:hypothetical protein [Deltaproteobacteria bacterium]
MITDKEKIKDIAQHGDFITGIHQYCDGWCERCAFTTQCLTFALETGDPDENESRDINNKAFWDQLAETFKAVSDQLREAMEAYDIDFDESEIQLPDMNDHMDDEIARCHESCRAARIYGEHVDSWFHQARDLFGEEDIPIDPGMEMAAAAHVEANDRLQEGLDVVRWYQHQIYVKLMRAVRSELVEARDGIDEFAKDSEGSAKVALIGIERSIAAWEDVRNHFPVMQDKVGELQGRLQRLSVKVEKAFPDARAFIRPGFDKIPLNG